MIPHSRRGRHRADFFLQASLHRPGFAFLWHHGDDFFRTQDLPDRHRDCSHGHVGQLREPTLVYLLLPASYIESHYQVWFLTSEIRWRIVKRQVPVFSDSHKSDINRTGNQFTANSLCDLLGDALSIQKVVLSDSGFVADSSFEPDFSLKNDPFQNVFPETGRMRGRQANVFVQVKKLDPVPIDVCCASQRIQKLKLRCPGCATRAPPFSRRAARKDFAACSAAAWPRAFWSSRILICNCGILFPRLAARLQFNTLSRTASRVNCFHQRNASPPFAAGATRRAVRLNRSHKILQRRLVPPHIADRR